jgi:hypothetical protein
MRTDEWRREVPIRGGGLPGGGRNRRSTAAEMWNSGELRGKMEGKLERVCGVITGAKNRSRSGPGGSGGKGRWGRAMQGETVSEVGDDLDLWGPPIGVRGRRGGVTVRGRFGWAMGLVRYWAGTVPVALFYFYFIFSFSFLFSNSFVSFT